MTEAAMEERWECGSSSRWRAISSAIGSESECFLAIEKNDESVALFFSISTFLLFIWGIIGEEKFRQIRESCEDGSFYLFIILKF